jgi:hypothetical protein
MSRVLCPALLVTTLLLNVARADAHVLAGTIVSVAVTRTGSVTVTIAAEADPLIAKLEALGGVFSDTPLTNDERRARLESLFPTLRAHIDGRLSGTPLDFTLRDVLVDDTAQVEVHLTARVPDVPQTFTWRSTFVFGAYQLKTTSADESEAVEWLQGPQTSTPIALEPSPEDEGSAGSVTYSRIMHGLAMGALVVYVLTRRRVFAQRAAGG